MNRRTFLATLSLATLAAPLAAESQQAGNVPRIGHLFVLPWSVTEHLREAFRQGLRELGYVEGQDIVIEFRSAEGRVERLPDLVAELVRLKVDVIVAAPDVSIEAARQATRTIPIVMAVSFDPVGVGFVASLARPGGNITGLSTLGTELITKRLELLKEVIPKLSRVAVLWEADNPSSAVHLREIQVTAPALGVQLQSLSLRGPNPDLESSFRAAMSERASALITVAGPLTFGHRTRIVDLAAKSRLPTLYDVREFVEAGGLFAYGASLPDMHRRAAYYVNKILKGAKPGDLPVEQPTQFEFVINLKTAKALGLTIPQTLLLRANQVIE